LITTQKQEKQKNARSITLRAKVHTLNIKILIINL